MMDDGSDYYGNSNNIQSPQSGRGRQNQSTFVFDEMISANILNKLSACMLFSNSMTFVFDGMDKLSEFKLKR